MTLYNTCIRLLTLTFALPFYSMPGDTVAELIESGHWKLARAIVDARMRQNPDDAAANFYLSQIRNAFGDRSTPLSLAERAVALDGRVARYHRQIAEIMGVMAQHSNALQQVFLARRFRKEIDAALELDPRDVQALRDLSEFYVLAPGVIGGDHRKARATAERILAIDPAEGALELARISSLENHAADAAVWLQRAVDTQPPSYRARIALAAFHIDREQPDFGPAEAAARAALQLDPGRAEARAILAEIYAAQSRWPDLEHTLEDSARDVPDDLAPYYRAARRIGDRDAARAERYLRIYLTREPEGNEPTLADAIKLRASLRGSDRSRER